MSSLPLIFYLQLLYETDAEHIFKNVSYGPLPHQQLDLYPVPLSSRTSPSPSPVLLFIQGGGWTICRKDFYPSLGRALRRSGIITVVPDYTTFPRGTMSNMEDDVIMCIQWTLDHVAEYGGDPRRVYLCGQSAGAHLCALAMTRHLEAHMASHVGVHVDDHVDNGPRGDHYDNHDKYQRDHATHATHVNHVNHANRVNHDNHDNHIPSPRGHPSPRGRLTRKCRSMPSLAGLDASARSSAAALWDGIRHVILISGPYDVPALHRHFELQGKDRLANLEEIFEGRGSYEHYSPRHILRRTIAAHGGSALIGVLPPVTLIYAGGDKTISLESTLAFDAELRSVDVKGKVIMYERQSHLEPLSAWSIIYLWEYLWGYLWVYLMRICPTVSISDAFMLSCVYIWNFLLDCVYI